jgi:DNA-directed RNA polymerase subunit RPC12/RpoP
MLGLSRAAKRPARVMSEFKFACPVCGQHIKCESGESGAQMECPTCFRRIIVPQAPADTSKFILSGAQVPTPRPVTQAPAPALKQTSLADKMVVAAVAALVLACVAGALVAFRGRIFEPPRGRATDLPASRASNNRSRATPVSVTGNAPSGSGGNNIALNKPASSGSQEQAHPAHDGNDGNLRTRWCASSGSVPQWWEVDLGGAATITGTQVTWERNAVYQYRIDASLDNANWTKVVDETTNSTWAKINSDSFSARGRYVRITVTGVRSGLWASFYEFQVFSPGGGSP